MSQFIHLHFSDSFTWSWGSAYSASLSQLTLTHDENPAHKALKQCHPFICKWYTLGHQWEKFLFLCILLHMLREIRERRWGTLYYAEFQNNNNNNNHSRNMTMKRNSNYLSYFFLHQQFLWEQKYISRGKSVWLSISLISQVLKF